MKAPTRVYIYFTRKRESKPVLNSKQINKQTNERQGKIARKKKG